MKTQFNSKTIIDFRPIFNATELKGIGRKSNHMHVLLAFQQAAECTVERFVEASNGWLLLASIPGRPGTGGIYLYDDRSKGIYWLNIAGREDDFNAADFDSLLLTSSATTPKPSYVSHRRRQHGRNHHHAINTQSKKRQEVSAPAFLQQAKNGIADIPHIAVN